MDDAARHRLTEALRSDDRVVFAYLFGSQGQGRAGPRSDVDVAVHVPGPADIDVELELQAKACSALRRDDVDLVVLGRAPLTLAFEALKGQLLFSKDEGARVEVEAALMSRYHDRVYYMRRHLAEFGRQLRERGFA